MNKDMELWQETWPNDLLKCTLTVKSYSLGAKPRSLLKLFENGDDCDRESPHEIGFQNVSVLMGLQLSSLCVFLISHSCHVPHRWGILQVENQQLVLLFQLYVVL